MQAELLSPQGPLQLGASRSFRLVGPAATMVAMARARIAEKFILKMREVMNGWDDVVLLECFERIKMVF